MADTYDVVVEVAGVYRNGYTGELQRHEVGDVLNRVLWDGVTPYNPGEGLRLQKSED